jgi:predicted enzyme related to lactoylglutathione lyase
MHLSVIGYVKDMERAVAFYESLGFQRQGEASPMWTEFAFGDATFALHRAMSEELAPPSDRLTLNITVDGEMLDRLHATCEAQGYPLAGPIADVGFGRRFTVTDPDGLPVTFIEKQGAKKATE